MCMSTSDTYPSVSEDSKPTSHRHSDTDTAQQHSAMAVGVQKARMYLKTSPRCFSVTLCMSGCVFILFVCLGVILSLC